MLLERIISCEYEVLAEYRHISTVWTVSSLHGKVNCLIKRGVFLLLYPLFSLEKKGILISYQSRSVVRPSVCPCVCASVTFLVIVSPPKP